MKNFRPWVFWSQAMMNHWLQELKLFLNRLKRVNLGEGRSMEVKFMKSLHGNYRNGKKKPKRDARGQ